MSERPALYLLVPAALLAAPVWLLHVLAACRDGGCRDHCLEQLSERTLSDLVHLGHWPCCAALHPVVPVALSRSMWVPIDLLTAGIFAYLALRKNQHDGPKPSWKGVPGGIVSSAYLI